ncbi:hypothetical protein PIB30_010267 [Stylosanthes scabra]|uniref:Uncharacterized protein n=1 Tax=Stylosanthes scabra TaxID=79078 RepID=A0ABU6T5D9_9FABA|nr:hypothetical protein [Stylosanthes scabra]
MSAELPWSTNTLWIIVSIVTTEITSDLFLLLVVCLISSEEKVILGGSLLARAIGLTSTAMHEFRLLLAAFLDGRFPPSGISPKIIAISRCTRRYLGLSLLRLVCSRHYRVGLKVLSEPFGGHYFGGLFVRLFKNGVSSPRSFSKEPSTGYDCKLFDLCALDVEVV